MRAKFSTATAAYFPALYSRPEVKNVTLTPTYTTAGGAQLTSGSGTMETTFMKVMGTRQS